MKLGRILRREREVRGLSVEAVAARLGVAPERYEEIEAGASPAEVWGPRLAGLAVWLEAPTARLVAASGRFADARPGELGSLVRRRREAGGKSLRELAEALGISKEEAAAIEAGGSELEEVGPLLLGFAEAIDQPVFNLLYPRGRPFAELDDEP